MALVLTPLLLSLTLAAGPEQTRPDFSGKWTKIPEIGGEPVEILTVTQTPDTLTIDSSGRPWVHKLDGSESKNSAMTDRNQAREVVSRSRWDGDTVVTLMPLRSNQDGPQFVRSVMSREGQTLVITVTTTSQTTGAVLSEYAIRYSK
jgi:hypothetical protein